MAPAHPQRPHSATAEHLTPRRRGGTDAQSNIVAAHKICNARRETTSASEPAWTPEERAAEELALLRAIMGRGGG